MVVRSERRTERGREDLEVAPAFEEWYLDFYPTLARTMTVMFSNVEVGRDIADEAMAKAFARWQKDDPPRSPNAWAVTVAVNEGRRRWRRRRREAERLARTADNVVLTAALGESDLDLWHAVAQLPPRSREAVVLRYLADLTEGEVAEVMGVKVGSISALLHKARASLRRLLAEEADDDRL